MLDNTIGNDETLIKMKDQRGSDMLIQDDKDVYIIYREKGRLE